MAGNSINLNMLSATEDCQSKIENRKSKIIGVDVGTGSVRAGLFTPEGVRIAIAVEPIQAWKPLPDHVEQSSEDIWLAVCKTVRSCVQQAGITPHDVVGISYDATCSLVVLDREDKPLTVALDGDNHRNIIVWMDHRALEETEAINQGGYDVLKYVGGKLSPEMETPKLKWLKTHLPHTWERAGKFLDLADFLTYRSTGSNARSLCTVVCKWTYLGHEGERGRWDRTYFKSIGIADALEGDKISNDVRPMGSPLGNLTAQAAAEMGLTTACRVGVGIIDAHAGGLGLLGTVFQQNSTAGQADVGDETTILPGGANTFTNGLDASTNGADAARLETALALIGGTSNCHMAVSREPKFIPGIWGPYYGAMVPGLWLTEGGQSAAGSAIDHVIADHANAANLHAQAAEQSVTVYQLLNSHLEHLQHAQNLPFPAQLTRDLHVLPYFLGNRSPNADPYARAMLDGLTLDESLTSQALRYYATLQAVAYGTRDIVRAMNEAGYRINTLFVTGGGTKNPLWLQEHADATGLTLVLPAEPEAVLLGSAMLAAVGAGIYPDVLTAMQRMSRADRVVRPDPTTAAYHAAKFEIFRTLYQEQLSRRERMAQI